MGRQRQTMPRSERRQAKRENAMKHRVSNRGVKALLSGREARRMLK